MRCSARNAYSRLDHIFVSTELLEHPPEVSIIDGGNNNSHHCIHGVSLHSTLTHTHVNQPAEKVKVIKHTSYDWSEDNIHVYYDKTCAKSLNLYELCVMMCCNECVCLNPAHNTALERLTNDILILVSSSNHRIKRSFYRLDRVPWLSESLN